MTKPLILILAAGLIVGCDRESGRGTSSPDASTQWGERGITGNVNSVGSPLGPLGATSVNPGTVTTGTTAELLIKTESGQPATPQNRK